MSCFFCESFYHLSQNCDIYVSNESRQLRAESKNCCSSCLSILYKNYGRTFPCGFCSYRKKCYICFSRDHHTVYCPDRFNDSLFFIPEIDKDLLPRFLQIQTLEAQYSLACTSPEASKFISLKPLAVVDSNSIYHNIFDVEKRTNFVVAESLNFSSTRYLMSIKTVIFKWKSICIKERTISSKEFLKLLLPRLIRLECIDVRLTSGEITFSSIMEKSPYLEVIILNQTIVKIGYSWLNDIITWKKRKDLRMLQIPLEEINFNVDDLVTVIKEKATTDIHILLDVSEHFDGTEYDQNIIDKLAKLLLSNFYPGKRCPGKAMVELYCPFKQISFVLFPSFSLD